MANNNFIANARRAANVAAFKVRKHSPEILVVTGIIGGIVGAVMACKATTKLDAVLENAKFEVNAIKSAGEKGEVEIRNPETQELEVVEYYPEEYKKDLALTYVKNGLNVVKVYAPAVVVGAASIGCIFQRTLVDGSASVYCPGRRHTGNVEQKRKNNTNYPAVPDLTNMVCTQRLLFFYRRNYLRDL